MCVQITTGLQANDQGNLILTVDGTVVANGTFYDRATTVFESCIKGLKTITVQNPSHDEWAGEIIIVDKGRSTIIECKTCTGDPYNGRVVVDGNSDSSAMANTQCFVNACSISWVVEGINIYDCPYRIIFKIHRIKSLPGNGPSSLSKLSH